MSFQIHFADRVATLQAAHPNALTEAASIEIPAAVRTAVEAALDRGETHYTDRPGILGLREKIAEQLRARFGIDAAGKSDLVVTCGLIEARFVAVQQLLQPGETIYSPDHADRIVGAAVLRRVKTISASPSAHVIYLTSSTPEATLRQRLVATSPEALVIFEVDDDTSTFHPAQVAGFADRTVTLGQLGHTSWQMGYLLSRGKESAGMRDFKQALTICSTNLSQWAALAAMETA